MGFIDKIISGGITNAVESLGNVADKFITTDAEREQFKLEVEKQKQAAKQAEDELTAKVEQAYLADVASSRETNAKIQESEHASFLAKNVGYLIDIFVITIWGGLTIYIVTRLLNLFHHENQPDLTNVFAIYSTITGVAMVIIQWHRGSSIGNAKNGAVMRRMLEKQNT